MTTRHALTQARKIAGDEKIDEGLRERLASQMMQVARTEMTHPPSASIGYGRLVYRLIAIALGLVALLVVVFAFILSLDGRTVESAFYSIGSAAIGALGGVFSPGEASGPAPGPAPNEGPGGGSIAPSNEAVTPSEEAIRPG